MMLILIFAGLGRAGLNYSTSTTFITRDLGQYLSPG